MAKQKVPYASLNTPVILVDLDILEANIKEMSKLADETGVKLRPHIKHHESAVIAKMQIEAGACGVDLGPIAQAEAMANEGINDIVVAHPGFYGGPKGETLKRLLSRPKLKLAIVIDMIEQAEEISEVAQVVGRNVPVIIKVDTNTQAGSHSRYGVLPGRSTVDLAKKLGQLSGVTFVGIYTHEICADLAAADKIAFETASLIEETAKMLKKEGLPVEHVTVGSSPTFRATCRYIKEGKFSEITEIHPGGCVIGDLIYVMQWGGSTTDSCALTVLTTVMSTSHPDYAMIDAGYKTLSARTLDPMKTWKGVPNYGSIRGRPDLWLGFPSAETSIVYYTNPKKRNLNLGERLEIVPASHIAIVNLHDQLYGVRKGSVERVIPVTGRGWGF